MGEEGKERQGEERAFVCPGEIVSYKASFKLIPTH